MSARFRIIHTEDINGTDVTFRADIHDADFAGTVAEKLAFDRFFEWDYEKLNERDPFENPVQKSSLTIDLAVLEDDDTEFTLLTDILAADESRFHIEFYINDVHKWSGPILMDLLEYPEGPRPFTGQIMAKDTSKLEGIDFDFVTVATYRRLSVLIADCLKETGLTLPLRSYTNLTNSNGGVDQNDDFLHALYHQKLALQDRGEALKCMDVLRHICRAYNLIIRQSDARWIIEQLPAVAKGDDEQFDYDANGENPVSSTPDRTITIDSQSAFLLPSSRNKITGPIKSISSVYNHRTLIFNIPTEDVQHDSPSDETVFDLEFESDGDFRCYINLDAEATISDPDGLQSGEAFFQIEGVRPGQSSVFYNQSNGFWEQTQQEVGVPITGSGSSITGTLEIRDNTDSLPSTVTRIKIIFLWAEVEAVSDGAPRTVTDVEFTDIDAYLFNRRTRDYEAAVKYKYTRSGNYSVTEEIPETVLGDGPTMQSLGMPSSSTLLADIIPPGAFKLRGVTENLTLEEILLRERISMRHDALRNLLAELWINYSPESLISYDGETWFFLGGNMVGNGSTWTANILKLSYSQLSGTFESIVQSGGDASGGGVSGSASSPDSGGGISEQEADDLYFRQENLFSEIAAGDRPTARDNIGLGSTDDVVFASIENTSGKFLSDNLFQFKNTADNAYQDIQARDATFRDLEVSGTINYVNEDNLQVEDKTITINKNGTDVSAVNAGIIVERPAGNKSFLWVDDYWNTVSGIRSAFYDVGATGHGFDSSGNVSAEAGEFAGNVTMAGLTATTAYFDAQVQVGDFLFINPTDVRFEVHDAIGEKAVMGYLGGIPKNDGTGNWGVNDYGFWVKNGDEMIIDGDLIYESGDWLIENDATIMIVDGISGNRIIAVGTHSGRKGLFLYDGNGDTDSDILVELNTSGLKAVNGFDFQAGDDFWRTSDDAFQFGGVNGIAYAGSGNITLGSNTSIIGDVNIINDGEITGTNYSLSPSGFVTGTVEISNGQVRLGLDGNIISDNNGSFIFENVSTTVTTPLLTIRESGSTTNNFGFLRGKSGGTYPFVFSKGLEVEGAFTASGNVTAANLGSTSASHFRSNSQNDSHFGRLASANTWSAVNTHSNDIVVTGSAKIQLNDDVNLVFTDNNAIFYDDFANGFNTPVIWIDMPATVNGNSQLRFWREGGALESKHFIIRHAQLRIEDHDTTSSSANTFIDSTTGAIKRSTSSAKYKYSITDLNEKYDALHVVNQLRSVWFLDKKRHTEHIGLIAEEVYRVIPELVTMHEDEPEGIEYPHLTSLLVQSVKDQQQQIADLQYQLNQINK